MQPEQQAINAFLASVQGKAFRMAMASLHRREDALDVVQDTMCKLVEKYCHKPAEQWPPLFYRILYSRITDLQRRRTRGRRLFAVFPSAANNDHASAFVDEYPDPFDLDPQRLGDEDKFAAALQRALSALPERQRQAFMLREWEGMNVADTAMAMGCSAGSVKTHFSRARLSLQSSLADYATDID